MAMDDRYNGFTVELFLDEDGDWLAHFEELPTVSAFGASPEEALIELESAWKGVKESYQSQGEKVPLAPSRKIYSGQFNIRIDKRLHRALAMEASRAGTSLNALVATKLSNTVEMD
ncbi:MAG: type II toxin-antitoxin system HicB family antitoxin [Magnetococcales bacterium]|nr:type II toxin-antitoxin system HicB family antitoxin [Magnetococcales bacterium]